MVSVMEVSKAIYHVKSVQTEFSKLVALVDLLGVQTTVVDIGK